jgi:hypothetical protein
MPPERSRQLVFELDAWYRSNRMLQKDLAATIGVTPQGLSEILSLRSKPSGETVLRIVEFLKENMSTGESIKTLSNALDRIAADREKIETLTAQLKAKATTLPPAPVQKPLATVTPPIAPKPATPPSTAAAGPVDPRGIGMHFNSGPPLTELSPIDRLRVQLNGEKNQKKRHTLYRQIKSLSLDGADGILAQNESPPFDPERDLPNFKRIEQTTAPIPKQLPVSADTPFKVEEILKLTNLEDLVSMLSNPVHSQLQKAMLYVEIKARRALVGTNC